jgi:hypothetical protein
MLEFRRGLGVAFEVHAAVPPFAEMKLARRVLRHSHDCLASVDGLAVLVLPLEEITLVLERLHALVHFSEPGGTGVVAHARRVGLLLRLGRLFLLCLLRSLGILGGLALLGALLRGFGLRLTVGLSLLVVLGVLCPLLLLRVLPNHAPA